MYAELRFGSDDERADIERRSLFFRDPVAVGPHDGAQRVEHVRIRDLRDAEAVVGIGHALDIFVRAEEQHAPSFAR